MTKADILKTVAEALLAQANAEEKPKATTKKKTTRKKATKKAKPETTVEEDEIEELDDEDLNDEINSDLDDELGDDLDEELEDDDDQMSQEEFKETLKQCIKNYRHKNIPDPKRARNILEKYKKKNKMQSLLNDAKPSEYKTIINLLKG